MKCQNNSLGLPLPNDHAYNDTNTIWTHGPGMRGGDRAKRAKATDDYHPMFPGGIEEPFPTPDWPGNDEMWAEEKHTTIPVEAPIDIQSVSDECVKGLSDDEQTPVIGGGPDWFSGKPGITLYVNHGGLDFTPPPAPHNLPVQVLPCDDIVLEGDE